MDFDDLMLKLTDLHKRVDAIEGNVKDRLQKTETDVDARVAGVHKRLFDVLARVEQRERSAAAASAGYFANLWAAIKGQRPKPSPAADIASATAKT